MNTKLMFSTGKDDWQTPKELFIPLNREFDFTLDAAANRDNALCHFFYGPGSLSRSDALIASWPTHDRIWVNPPYSRGLQARFIEQAAETAKRGGLVVMLLPARTDTKAFHRYIYKQPGVEIRFLQGRLKFVGAKSGAPFPSMIVIFRRPE